MNIVFFAHPSFFDSQSTGKYVRMLAEGMRERGHRVEIWQPKALFFHIPFPAALKKWLGYIDQYIIFPWEVKRRLKTCLPDTLFAFTDQAQGPWVPLVADSAHVIHCHDFLAQRSALGQIRENVTRWTGRQYQAFIRRGYFKGKNFISVSQKTKEDLHQFLNSHPARSNVVYNGLNQFFTPGDPESARAKLGRMVRCDLGNGYLLHIGGNQWYKNRKGVIEIYNTWRSGSTHKLPLLLIGKAPSPGLVDEWEKSLYKPDIHFLSGVDDEYVRLAYTGATVFLFPSLSEGFGWPIAEAMASGCPVITTNEAPMTEVAGKAGFLIPRRPADASGVLAWTEQAAKVVDEVIGLTPEQRKIIVEAGLANAKRFDPEHALNQIEAIYQSITLK